MVYWLKWRSDMEAKTGQVLGFELRFLPTNRLYWFLAESPSSWLSFTQGHKKFCAGTELNCARIMFWWYGITAELKVLYGAKIIILLIPWTKIKCFQENQTALDVLEHTDTLEKLGCFFFFLTHLTQTEDKKGLHTDNTIKDSHRGLKITSTTHFFDIFYSQILLKHFIVYMLHSLKYHKQISKHAHHISMLLHVQQH